ncbi:hypothetical protein [Crocosphaera sp. UHCC 0190]|uniref:hypothetical protein n=1 Tax=Crocosphaera sp. UHCC 0190 TaxID=3110246 RepID=UPI002B1E9AD9|nr:hypothetical protein [Crocosphaera sp. UHCC 0190]
MLLLPIPVPYQLALSCCHKWQILAMVEEGLGRGSNPSPHQDAIFSLGQGNPTALLMKKLAKTLWKNPFTCLFLALRDYPKGNINPIEINSSLTLTSGRWRQVAPVPR